MSLISSSCDSQKSLLPVLLSLLPRVILKSPKSITLFFWLIFLYNNFFIFLINICLSMRRSFAVPGEGGGGYEAKTATYLPAGSVMICSIGGAVLFVNTKTPKVCVFPGEIMTSPFQSSLMLCRWEKFAYVSCKMEKFVSNVLQ